MTRQPDIRPLAAADRDGVLALAHRLTTGVAPWRDQVPVARAVHDWVVDSVEGADAARAPVWVAFDGPDVVGFVTAGTRKHWSGESDAYVGELVVAQEWSGLGVGRHLMQTAEEWARCAGHRRLSLETGAANHGARAFYATLGYVEEEVVLTRALSPAADASGVPGALEWDENGLPRVTAVVVDTSALVALTFAEPATPAVSDILRRQDRRHNSSAAVVELGIVVPSRTSSNVAATEVIDAARLAVEPFEASDAQLASGVEPLRQGPAPRPAQPRRLLQLRPGPAPRHTAGRRGR